MEKGDWFTGPEWLQNEEKWPEQPTLARSTEASEEEKPLKEVVARTREHRPEEWDQFLESKPYWTVLRITAWAIRFKDNTLAKKQMRKKRKGALCTDEIRQAKELWVRRAQKRIPQDTETPGWRLVEDKETGVLKCVGRIPGYRPTYIEDCLPTQKLIRHLHSEINHLGVANTMVEIIKERMVDSKTKMESEENGQHVQPLQGFQHETLWSYSNSRHATVPRGSQQTF